MAALVTAPLGRRDTFPYRTLADGEIRVVTIEKHSQRSRADRLTCTIGYVSLEAVAFSFIALSYVWGDGQDATKLEIRDETSGKVCPSRKTKAIAFLVLVFRRSQFY